SCIKSTVPGTAGFEPAIAGSKFRRLTTCRRPNAISERRPPNAAEHRGRECHRVRSNAPTAGAGASLAAAVGTVLGTATALTVERVALPRVGLLRGLIVVLPGNMQFSRPFVKLLQDARLYLPAEFGVYRVGDILELSVPCLPAGHGHKSSELAQDDLQIVHDKAIVEGYGDIGLQLVIRFDPLDANVRDFHEWPPPGESACADSSRRLELSQ